MGKPVIMGRKTWDSLPRAPARPHQHRRSPATAPSSRRAHWSARTSRGRQIAREQAEEDGATEVCVIGGASLFALALPKAKRIYLTEVEAEPEGDVTSRRSTRAGWKEVARAAHSAGPDDDFPFVFRVLERA